MGKRSNLIQYLLPEDLKQYLSSYGMHFNKKLCEWATSKMEKKDVLSGKMKPIKPVTMDELEQILAEYDVKIDSNSIYDALYLASMVKADYMGSSIEDKEHMAKYIKDVINDPDGYDGIVFNRFRADCDAKGVVIFWERFL